MIHDVKCNFCRVKKLPLYVVENTTMDENSVVDATENTAMDVTENGTVYETKRVTIDGARVVNIFQLEQYIMNWLVMLQSAKRVQEVLCL